MTKEERIAEVVSLMQKLGVAFSLDIQAEPLVKPSGIIKWEMTPIGQLVTLDNWTPPESEEIEDSPKADGPPDNPPNVSASDEVKDGDNAT